MRMLGSEFWRGLVVLVILISCVCLALDNPRLQPTSLWAHQLRLADYAITGFFRDRGFSIDWNHPYAGGFITREYGKADSQRQAVQIEINRGLYMDGSTRLNQPRVAGLRDTIAEFGQFLTSHCRGTV